VLAAQQQTAEAGSAQTRAEADRAAADRRATEDRAALERVRAELEQLRADHHAELVAARREAAEERAALRREAGEQLSAVLARFDTASGADTASPPALARRGQPKTLPRTVAPTWRRYAAARCSPSRPTRAVQTPAAVAATVACSSTGAPGQCSSRCRRRRLDRLLSRP
jgi:hypothetical protein